MVVWQGETAEGHGYPDGWWNPSVFWHGVIKRKGKMPKIEVSPGSYWQYTPLEDIEWAIGMGPIVLSGGIVQVLDSRNFPGVNPVLETARVGFGITADNKAVFAYLDDATAMEMGQYLKSAGAVNGILADGGSSASYKDGAVSKGSQLVPNALLWRSPEPDEPAEPDERWDRVDTLMGELEGLLVDLRTSQPTPTPGEPVGVSKPRLIRPDYEGAGGGWDVTEATHYMNPDGVKYLVLHHDGGSVHVNKTALQIHQWHRMGRGWDAIGYQVWGQMDGTLEEGRPLNRQGAHIAPYNGVAWGASMAGNYTIAKEIPKPLRDAMVHLFAYWKTLRPNAKIVAHRELVSSQCPGTNIDMDEFRADVEEYLRRRGV